GGGRGGGEGAGGGRAGSRGGPVADPAAGLGPAPVRHPPVSRLPRLPGLPVPRGHTADARDVRGHSGMSQPPGTRNRRRLGVRDLPRARRFARPRRFGVGGGFAVLGSPARGGKIEESVTGRSKETACEVSRATAEEGEAAAPHARTAQ